MLKISCFIFFCCSIHLFMGHSNCNEMDILICMDIYTYQATVKKIMKMWIPSKDDCVQLDLGNRLLKASNHTFSLKLLLFKMSTQLICNFFLQIKLLNFWRVKLCYLNWIRVLFIYDHIIRRKLYIVNHLTIIKSLDCFLLLDFGFSCWCFRASLSVAYY